MALPPEYQHGWDEDCCCIHCGMDGADWPRGEPVPACTVNSPEVREANSREYFRRLIDCPASESWYG